MPDRALAEQSPHEGDYVVRSDSLRLVDYQDGIHCSILGRGARACLSSFDPCVTFLRLATALPHDTDSRRHAEVLDTLYQLLINRAEHPRLLVRSVARPENARCFCVSVWS